jgi:glycogen debranching enzyme
VDGIEPYVRKDITHVDPSERPTQFEYDRYVALVQCYRQLGWDNERLHDAAPFRVVDPGFNAILIHSEFALARLARALGQGDMAERLFARAQRCVGQMEQLWNPELGQYSCFDRRSGRLVNSASIGGLLPLLVLPTGHARAQLLAQRIQHWLALAPFGVCSMDPNDSRFDGRRYWRGPSWLIVNYLLIKGLRQAGMGAVAKQVLKASMACIEQSGCSEYYHPITGEALGGGTFTWTAAMVVEFLTVQNQGL